MIVLGDGILIVIKNEAHRILKILELLWLDLLDLVISDLVVLD